MNYKLEVITIELKDRQKEIIEIVKNNQPITSEAIAQMFGVTRSALRSDLSVLTMSGLLEAKPKVGYYYVDQSDRERMLDFIKVIKVDDVKSLPIVVDEKVSVYDAIVTMFLEDVGSICIISDGYLAGVVSRKDFLKAAIGGTDMKHMPVGMIMTRMPNIVVTYPKEPIYEAARKIIEHEIDALPIVEEVVLNGKSHYKVLGRLSKTNITKLFVNMTE